MTLVSNIPPNTWNGHGLDTPDEDVILEGVVKDVQLAFNNNLNLDPSNPSSMATPQGQLSTSITQIKGEINDNLRFLSNQINPRYSSGIYQDALAWLYFITRKPATPTMVSVDCYGLDGTVILAGAKIKSSLGDTFIAANDEVILSGMVTVEFYCEEKGVVYAPPNTLTEIQRTVIGWDSCTNPTAGITGRDEESRADFEERRYDSVAKNAHGTLSSIYASVFELEDVLDVYAYENVTNQIEIVDGYPIKEHSLYIAVTGGKDEEIARAIFLKKDVGSNYNGNTVVNIKDLNYTYPHPNYDVKFERPAPLAIKFRLRIVNDPLLPANASRIIRTAMIESFNGEDERGRARIGSDIIANRFVGNIIKHIPLIGILDIDLGTTTPNLNKIHVKISEYPTLSRADIEIIYV